MNVWVWISCWLKIAEVVSEIAQDAIVKDEKMEKDAKEKTGDKAVDKAAVRDKDKKEAKG